jgi:putative flippase GtrA
MTVLGQICRFCIVGGANTAIGLAVIFALVWCGVNDILANLAGYAAGFTIGYIMNAKWTFKRQSSKVGAVKYFVLMAVCYFLNLTVMLVLRDFANVDKYLAQVSGMVAYSLAGFLGSWTIVFAEKGSSLETRRGI